MERVVGIRFKKAGKIYYFGPNDLTLNTDDGVIVETARGMEYGYVAIAPRDVDENEVVAPLRMIVRKATVRDMKQLERNHDRETAAFDICQEKIKKFKCPMKLLRVEYTFDRSKIIFFFTAANRVDFRELVKDLAAVFHTRIELRQVGVRDEAKQLSGVGSCGRTFCCSSFLGEFAPVSIRMAKNQGLSLNPSKISGACGRLMCCLRYENDMYTSGEVKRKNTLWERNTAKEPVIGMEVVTDDGTGRIIHVNTQKKTVRIQLADQKSVTLSWEEIAAKEDE